MIQLMLFLFGIACIGGLIFGAVVLRALIISQIWGWYMIPIFGLAPLTLVYAFGFSCFVQLFHLNMSGMKADIYADSRISKWDKSVPALTAGLVMLSIWGMAAIGRNWLPEEIETEVVVIEQVIDHE